MKEQLTNCTNFDNCKKADSKEVIPIAVGEELICPECKKALYKVDKIKVNPPWGKIAIVAGIAAVLGGLGWWVFTEDKPLVKYYSLNIYVPEQVLEAGKPLPEDIKELCSPIVINKEPFSPNDTEGKKKPTFIRMDNGYSESIATIDAEYVVSSKMGAKMEPIGTDKIKYILTKINKSHSNCLYAEKADINIYNDFKVAESIGALRKFIEQSLSEYPDEPVNIFYKLNLKENSIDTGSVIIPPKPQIDSNYGEKASVPIKYKPYGTMVEGSRRVIDCDVLYKIWDGRGGTIDQIRKGAGCK